MKINLHIQRKRLKTKDLLAIEDASEGRRAVHTIVDVVAKCMRDAEGNYLEKDVAVEILLELDLEELDEVVAALKSEMERLQKEAVPPPKGSR